MTVTIRPADFATDRDTISLLMQSLQTHEKTVRPQRDDWANIKDDYLAFLAKTVSDQDGVCLIAEVDSQSVGLICGWVEQPDEPRMDTIEPAYGYIGEGVVLPNFQRHGIYQQLVDAITAYFKDKDLTHIRTTLIDGNVGITEFLRKNGFTPYYTCFEKELN